MAEMYTEYDKEELYEQKNNPTKQSLDNFTENLENIISDSEMDSDENGLCKACKLMGGNEKLRDEYVLATKEAIIATLGRKAASQYASQLIKEAGECYSSPSNCNKFNK